MPEQCAHILYSLYGLFILIEAFMDLLAYSDEYCLALWNVLQIFCRKSLILSKFSSNFLTILSLAVDNGRHFNVDYFI